MGDDSDSSDDGDVTVLSLLRPMVEDGHFRVDPGCIRNWPVLMNEDTEEIEDLDLENMDYYSIGTSRLEMACGGDWQDPMMMRIELSETHPDTLEVTKIWKSKVDLGLDGPDAEVVPWPRWILERNVLHHDTVVAILMDDMAALEKNEGVEMDILEDGNILYRGSVPGTLHPENIPRVVYPPDFRMECYRIAGRIANT